MHQCYLDTTALLSVLRRCYYPTPSSPREISINFLFLHLPLPPDFPDPQSVSYFPVAVCVAVRLGQV